MITYGHQKYIRQAIESILNQNVDFDIELILSNDCSPDKTDQVVQNILENHQKSYLIKYYFHKKNLGMMLNFQFALEKCSGKYIAICDGDDFWIDDLKLAKQIKFLDNNPEYVIHSGNSEYIAELDSLNGAKVINKTGNISFEIDDFYYQNNLISSTVMFRNLPINFDIFFKNSKFGDWSLYVLLMQKSNLKAFRTFEVFSNYRVHNQNTITNINTLNYYDFHINHVLAIKKQIGYYGFPEKNINTLNNYFFNKTKYCIENKLFIQASKTIIKNLKTTKSKILWPKYFKLLIKKYCL